MQSPPFPRYLVPPRFNYSPQSLLGPNILLSTIFYDPTVYKSCETNLPCQGQRYISLIFFENYHRQFSEHLQPHESHDVFSVIKEADY